MGKKNFYAVIDTETCTLPELKAHYGDQAGLIFPLVYDLGLVIMDRQGEVYHRQSWIISETYSNPSLFNTGYYADKRPLYEARIRRGETKVETWNNAKFQLLQVMERFDAIACAYNAFFDFKKAFHATNRFNGAIYKPDGKQATEALVKSLTTKKPKQAKPKQKKNEEIQFWLVDRWFRVIDIWDFACETLFQRQTYKEMALNNGWYSEAGNYKTNAEVAYAYITDEPNYSEEHMAVDDCDIEAQILAYIFSKYKVKVPYGITAFPWRKVGKVEKG